MNIVSLQRSLARQMELLEAGKIDPKRVNAACNIASKFISTVRLKLDFARHVGAPPSVPELSDQSHKSRR